MNRRIWGLFGAGCLAVCIGILGGLLNVHLAVTGAIGGVLMVGILVFTDN